MYKKIRVYNETVSTVWIRQWNSFKKSTEFLEFKYTKHMIQTLLFHLWDNSIKIFQTIRYRWYDLIQSTFTSKQMIQTHSYQIVSANDVSMFLKWYKNVYIKLYHSMMYQSVSEIIQTRSYQIVSPNDVSICFRNDTKTFLSNCINQWCISICSEWSNTIAKF